MDGKFFKDLITKTFKIEFVWIFLGFLVIVIITWYIQKKTKEDFVKELSKVLFVPFVILMLIFLGYSFFPDDQGLFDKLVSGEVIVGITVAFPTLYTWYKKEKEEKKSKQEYYTYQSYTELKNDYIMWHEDFNEEKVDLILAVVKLNQLLDRVELFQNRSNNSGLIPIDFETLFVVIQQKIEKDIDIQNENDIPDIYESWRSINNRIIKKMSYSHYYNNAKKIFAIDFVEQSDLLMEFTRFTYFTGCKFKKTQLLDFINQNGGSYEFNNIVLNSKLSDEELNEIKDNVELGDYFYYDEMGEVFKETRNDIENKQKEFEQDSSIEQNSSNKNGGIYENRDLSNFGPINNYIVMKEAIEISILTTNNIKNKIFDEIKKKEEGVFDELTRNEAFISTSKNYIPEMKNSDKDKWQWHSWNVLKEDNINNAMIKFFIFAVKIDETKFECIVIGKSQLLELLKKKRKTKDMRYYFYLAKQK